MKIKISQTKILLILFFLFDVRLMFLIPLPAKFAGDGTNKMLLSVYSIILFFLFLGSRRLYLGKYTNCLVSLFLIIFLNTVNAFLTFGYNVTQLLWPVIPFFLLLLYFILMNLLKSEHYLRFFIKAGEFFWSILCILFLIQRILYLRNHAIILKLEGMLPDYYLRHPELGFRIYSVFEGFLRVFILCVGFICINRHFKHCKSEIICLILSIAAVVLVDRSRYYLFTLILGLIAIFLWSSRRSKHFKKNILAAVAIIVGFVFLNKLFASMAQSIGENTGSSFARSGAISYYMNLLKTHFLFGLSMVSPDEGSSMYYFVHGPAGYFHYDDIGLIGTYAKLGIFALVWYIYILIKTIYFVVNTRGNNKALSVGLIIMMLVSSITQSYLDPQRLMSLLFTFIFIELNYSYPQLEY